MKIVINKCYGGFGLSPIAIKRYLELKGEQCFFYRQDPDTRTYTKIESLDSKFNGLEYTFIKDLGESFNTWPKEEGFYFSDSEVERTDPLLIQVVEELGDAANSWASKLRVVEIPDDIQWELDDYDGIETVHEVHRSW